VPSDRDIELVAENGDQPISWTRRNNICPNASFPSFDGTAGFSGQGLNPTINGEPELRQNRWIFSAGAESNHALASLNVRRRRADGVRKELCWTGQHYLRVMLQRLSSLASPMVPGESAMNIGRSLPTRTIYSSAVSVAVTARPWITEHIMSPSPGRGRGFSHPSPTKDLLKSLEVRF
jgi:hypothetical protein